MQNLLRRIEKAEDRLGMGVGETPLQSITRKQECLKYFYSLPKPTQTAMVSFAKANSQTTAGYVDNIRTFQRLVDQDEHGRKWVVKHPLLVMGGEEYENNK